jgi:hypothetical protein
MLLDNRQGVRIVFGGLLQSGRNLRCGHFFACFLLRGRLHWGFLSFPGGVYGD